MTSHVRQRSKWSILLYTFTLLAFLASAYVHIGYATDYEWNVTWSLLLDIFPVFFLFLAFPILLVGTVTTFFDPVTGARLAQASSILAWLYYGVMICVASLAFTPFILFVTRQGLIMLIVPTGLLFVTTRHARRILRKKILQQTSDAQLVDR